MSASVEIFDTLAPQARAFTRREMRETRAPVSSQKLSAFLDDALARYVASGGVAELTEAVIADTRRSITRYCLAMPVQGYSAARQRLFRAMAPMAKAWAKADRKARRAPVDRDRLRSYLQREAQTFCGAPGQACEDGERAAVVEALAAWFGRMRAVKAEAVRKNATRAGRDEVFCDVDATLDYEAMVAEREGREPNRLSIDAIHARLKVETVTGPNGTTVERLTGVTRSAVRGAVERLQGQPRRADIIDRFTPTTRDLVGAIEAELPGRRISVVETDALAGKLWAPARTAEARRQHARRLRVSAEVIEGAGIGLHIAVVGAHTVVGRGRKLPEGGELQAVVERALAPKPGRKGISVLSRGLVPSRQGLWGSVEGQVAQSMCRVAASHAGHDDVWVTLAAVGQDGAAQDFSTVWDQSGEPVQADSLALADAVEKASQSYVYGRLSPQAQGGVDLIRTIVTRAREAGLDQAWAGYVARGDLAARLRRPERAGARERVRRIGAALSKAPCPEAWEAAVLLDAYAVRPGRRHSHPVVYMPRPTKSVAAPAPAPKAEFYPTHVKDVVLSLEMAEEVSMHWSRSKVREAFRALHSVYLGYDIEDTKLVVLKDLPRPSTVEDVTEALRRILRWWKAPELSLVARVDQDLQGAMHAAIMAAGLALRDHGARALYHAASTVSTICTYSSNVEALQGLPRRLSHIEQHLRWSLAQTSSAA